MSVWTIVPTATLPASSNRSACAAMLIVPRVTARTSTTAMCVATPKLSVTMESVCLSVPLTLTMIRLPMNAEVGKVEVAFDHAKYNKTKRFYILITGCISWLCWFVLISADCDKSCLTCSGHEPSSCSSCGTDRLLDASGHCVFYSECSLRSYKDKNGECQQCHKICHRCFGPDKDHCLSCNEPYFLLSMLLK